MDYVAVGSFLFNCFYMAAMGFVSSMLPLYATELGADVTSIGPIWTIAYLSSFVMALFWGSLSDRSGKRMPHIIVGTTAMSIVCILYTFAENIYSMSAVMILGEVLGSSQAFPTFMTLVSELARTEKRGRSMGVFWMGGSVGWAVSVSVAGFIAQQYGIRRGFYLSSILYLTSLFVARYFLGAHAKRAPSEKQVTFGDAIRGFKRFGSAFLVFWVATICFYIGDIVKVSFVLIFFERELGINRALATLILSLGTWAEIPSLPLLGTLSDRIGRKPLLLLGLFTFSIFNALMSFSQNYIHAGLTMLLFGLIWGSFTSASSALVGDMVEEQSRAKAMSLYNSASSIASIVAPTVMSLAILQTSFRTAFIVIAAILATGFLLILLGVPPKATGDQGAGNRKPEQPFNSTSNTFYRKDNDIESRGKPC